MPPGGISQAPGTLIRTREGLITFWSPEMEDRYGFAAGEVVGRISHELLRPWHWQSYAEIEAILDERSEWNGGLIVHRVDGQSMMVANYWHLHSGTGGAEPLVTEVHTDIVQPSSPASSELADVVKTIAQELSQPLTAAGAFIAGSRRSLQSAEPDRELLDRGLRDAAAQLERAGELLNRVRALGGTLRDPRLREVHARLTAAMTRSARVARESQKVRKESGVLAERGLVSQNISVFRRRLAAEGATRLDEHTEQVLRQLLAEEEAKLAALDRQDSVAN